MPPKYQGNMPDGAFPPLAVPFWHDWTEERVCAHSSHARISQMSPGARLS
jgi:hypothetical protein